MKRIGKRVAGVLGALGMASMLVTGTAQADDGPVYFNAGGFHCAIFADGTVGCDTTSPTRLQYSFLPFLLTVNEMVIDQPWLPAHPTFDSGTRYTLPGGNPWINNVKTGDGAWGPYIEFAGARCESGFHGSFGCKSKGRGWTAYSGTISA
ncbi:hypothetical protein [Nocardia sp. NPDC050710]|uniref:hypothetical protein n=1 Tax=Nocardia sp. NPDC050710 TaxID=3157220 RepID=UPI0033EF4B1E